MAKLKIINKICQHLNIKEAARKFQAASFIFIRFILLFPFVRILRNGNGKRKLKCDVSSGILHIL